MDLMESFTINANSEQSYRTTYTTINPMARNKLDPSGLINKIYAKIKYKFNIYLSIFWRSNPYVTYVATWLRLRGQNADVGDVRGPIYIHKPP